MSLNRYTVESIRQYIRSWNLKYPIDKWWRLKYNIPFNSPQHNAANLLDMRIEYEEFLLYKQLDDVELDTKKDYRPGYGDWLDTSKPSMKMSREEVDAINIDDFDLDTLKDTKSITIPNG